MKELLVRHIMSKSFETVRADDILQRVIDLMRKTKLDGLPVVDADGRLIGMMPKTNLFEAIGAGFPLHTPITAHFVQEPVAFRESMPYTVAAETVRSTKIGSAPVVDDHGKVRGIVTKASVDHGHV